MKHTTYWIVFFLSSLGSMGSVFLTISILKISKNIVVHTVMKRHRYSCLGARSYLTSNGAGLSPKRMFWTVWPLLACFTRLNEFFLSMKGSDLLFVHMHVCGNLPAPNEIMHVSVGMHVHWSPNWIILLEAFRISSAEYRLMISTMARFPFGFWDRVVSYCWEHIHQIDWQVLVARCT